MTTGYDKLRTCFKGNEEAVQLMAMIREISHTWDDLVDRDKQVTPTQIHRVFWMAFVGLRTNPFWVCFEKDLAPVLEAGVFNYIASCELERTPGHSRQIAHTARYQAGDVALVIARLIGGADWAMQVAAELKLLLHTDRYEDFDKEMELRHAQDRQGS